MNTTDSLAKEIRKLANQQDRLLKRVRGLAPEGVEEVDWKKDGTASSWQWTLWRLSDAHWCLDDLAYDPHYAELGPRRKPDQPESGG
jgi:hypothetical protein